MKKIDASAHIGDSGIALIHTLVNKMGFAWHERKLDAGIDADAHVIPRGLAQAIPQVVALGL